MVARLPVGKIDRREKAWNGLSEQSTTYWLVDMPTLLNSSSRAGYSDHRVSNDTGEPGFAILARSWPEVDSICLLQQHIGAW
jgi:hypothetical protein